MQTTSSPTSSRRSTRRRATALALWLALSGLLVAAAFYGQSQEDSPEDALYDPSLAINGLILYGLLVAISLAIARLFPRPLDAVGFRRFAFRWVWIGFAVVVATLIVARIAEPFLHGGEDQGFAPDRWEPEHAAAFAVNSAVVILVGPFAEELFFRGLGVRVVAIWGATAAIVVTAVIFGLVHGVIGALPPLIFFGLGLAWVRVRSASVWPSFVAHAGYNGLGILLLALAWALDIPTS
jgi:membrane protease YdiL (CAAX protease family)